MFQDIGRALAGNILRALIIVAAIAFVAGGIIGFISVIVSQRSQHSADAMQPVGETGEVVEAAECCPEGSQSWREQGVDRAKLEREARAARGEVDQTFRCGRCGRAYRVRVLVSPHTGESGP